MAPILVKFREPALDFRVLAPSIDLHQGFSRSVDMPSVDPWPWWGYAALPEVDVTCCHVLGSDRRLLIVFGNPRKIHNVPPSINPAEQLSGGAESHSRFEDAHMSVL
jgi:hypothetical protein